MNDNANVPSAEESPNRAYAESDGGQSSVSVPAALEVDRKLKETRLEVQRQLRSNNQLHDVVHQLSAENAQLRHQVVALQQSASLRLGRRIVQLGRPVAPIVRSSVRALRRRGRDKSISPEAVRVAYAAATAAGAPLQTVRTADRNAVFSVIPDSQVGDVGRSIMESRTNAPRLLDDHEWDLIAKAVASGEEMPFSVGRCSALRQLDLASAPSVTPLRLVIDVRPAQMINPCGTRTHARAVLREILASVPEGIRVESLSDYRLPLLDPAEYPRIDDEWDRGNVDTVGAFFNLSALGSVALECDLPLLTNPGIRTASVWLDAILGLYPHVWFKSMDHIFGTQFQMECLGRHDWVIALSQTSASEATFVAKPDAKIVISGAWSMVDPAADVTTTGVPFAHYVAVVGSDLPHKNVAAGVAGAAPIVANRPDWGIVVSGNVAPLAADALRSMSASLGLSDHQLIVNALPDTTTHAAILEGAAVVVVPSFHEGYSLPVIEAIALHTPVAISDIPAHRELLPDGVHFFDPADPATLTTALQQVLNVRDVVAAQQFTATEQLRDRSRFAASIQRVVSELCADLDPDGRSKCAGTVRGLVRARETASLSKICEVEDFSVPRIREVIREVFSHELVRFGNNFPSQREYRKYWEVAMAVLAFREGGHLNDEARLLGVGAGNEPTVFFLTRFAKEVIATDLYLSPGWEESANASMLTEPQFHWPFSWEPSRLTVQHMDALALDLPDESVDGIFSSSSVEHFGTRADVAKSIDEAFRVLKPGGVLSVSTEFCLRGSREGFPGVLLFDEADITEIFLGNRDWALMEPFDNSVSPATRATAASFAHVATDQQKQIDRLGGLWTHHIEYAKYPHIVLNLEEQQWTSFHIALRKPI